MAKYIDKDALLAKIEKILLIHTKRYEELAKHEVWVTAKEIEYRIQGLKEALSIINTLEVKEVDLEKEIIEECHFRKVGCEMYEGHILECEGACGWIVDHPKLKELKTQKRK